MLCVARDFTPIVHAETQRSYVEHFGRIAVFYDPSDLVTSSIAENLYRVLDRFYSPTVIITVSSFVELEEALSEEFFVNIYVLRGDGKGLHVGEEIVPWSSFGELLSGYRRITPFGPMEHIVATGAAGLLLPYLESYEGFHVESSPVIDARLCYFYGLWTTAEILASPNGYRTQEMLTAGETLRKAAIVYFGDDFNELVLRVIEPVDPLGEEVSGSSLASRPEFAPSVTQVYPTPETLESDQPVLAMGLPSSSSSTMGAKSSGSLTALAGAGESSFGQGGDEYYSLAEIPVKSGVDGPVGKVVDALLGLLTKWLSDKGWSKYIGIRKELGDTIIGYVHNFTKWLNATVIGWIDKNIVKPLNLTMTAWAFLGIWAAGLTTAIALAIDADFVMSQLPKLTNLIASWAAKEANKLLNELNKLIEGLLPLKYEIKLPVGFGDFSLFQFFVKLQVKPGFGLDEKRFAEFLNQSIWEGTEFLFSFDFFKDLLSFIEIIPMFSASIGVSSFGSDKNGLVKYLFELLGVELKFSGEGGLEMALLTASVLKLGQPHKISFFDVRKWFFKFSLELSKRFTIFDFFTAGAGGAVLAKAAEYIGLGHFYITVFFRVTVEVVKTIAAAGQSASSKLTLDITLGLVADLKVLIVQIKGGLEVTMRFIQDFLADTPLEIFLILYLWFEVVIDLYFVDLKVGKWEWWPFEKEGLRLAGGKGDKDYEENAVGQDSDGDGLSDEFEGLIAELAGSGLDPNDYDTDDDKLWDKFELDVSRTMPDKPDTDGDGLSDGDEWNKYLTDPLKVDTDFDGLRDDEEVKIYGTSPLLIDTDADGLSDYAEIHITYNFTGTGPEGRGEITPTVTSVTIGGEPAYNHTDPLNPDTDGDGLLDGQEGEKRSAYWGDPKFNTSSLTFNKGYTHPLDYDTDDDSYEQMANGSITERRLFYRDMNDGVEVYGQLVNLVNVSTGESLETMIYTNPCNPDTDDDSAGSFIINSDGRELSLTPPTNPTEGDTDHDGLIDGLEGTLKPDSYHTNPNNADTDGDGLSDGGEVQGDTDPLNSDTDGDQVSDGDEVMKFYTDPLVNDTDGDLLLDGEELFFFYSDPFIRDSDNDTLIDGYEAHVYGTDPVNQDTDGDALDDAMEALFLRTDPLNRDTDEDGIYDWDEVELYHTNPLSWDSDYDSITEPNEYGQMTLPSGDYEEIFIYGTDPLSDDTDKDGLTDAQELHLAQGWPGFEPIPLSPLNNDTDSDGLTDGTELKIETVVSIVYPYTAQIIVYPHNSSAVLNDTDQDGLLDGEEVQEYRTNPSSNDTDDDTLTDWDEVHVYGTDPANNDTDGDDLADNLEIAGFSPATNPTQSDSDGDMLPDGLELVYGTDPWNYDTDGDGIKDGDEFDTDGDGVSDGDEFYIYNTNHVATVLSHPVDGALNLTSLNGYPSYLVVGGFDNPDSDMDGLEDGDEVYVYGTDVTNADTDGDGFSDGDELTWGTDPFSPTSQEEVMATPAFYTWNLTVHVVDSQSGADIASASVYLTNSSWTSSTQTTNSTGFSDFYNVRGGIYTMEASASGYLSNHTTIFLNQSREVTVGLTPMPPEPPVRFWRVTVHVIAADSGADIPSASVYLTNDTWTSQTQTTNSTGYSDFLNIREGVYATEVSAPGYVKNHTTIDLSQTQTVTIELSPEPSPPPPPLIPSSLGVLLLVGVGVLVGGFVMPFVIREVRSRISTGRRRVKSLKREGGKET